MIDIVKGFSIVNEAEVDVFLEFFCFFYDPMDLGSLILDSSDFSKFSLYIGKFSVHILMKTSLRILSRFEVCFFFFFNEVLSCFFIWNVFLCFLASFDTVFASMY